MSEDRKGEGLALPLSVADNVTLTRLSSCSRAGVLDPRAQRAQAEERAREVDVRMRGAGQPVRTLSGGNQQKVAFARIVHQQAEVLLLDEPTRGIDVASKAQLYAAIVRAGRGRPRRPDGELVPSRAVRRLRPCRGHVPRPPGRGAAGRGLDARERPRGGDRRMSPELRQRLVRLGPFLGLALVVVFFAIASGAPERYLSANNLRVVLAQTVIVAIGAIGMTLVIVGGGIDLSVGSTIALTGVITALAIRDGWSPVSGVLAAVLAGGLVGLLNGLAITRLKVVPFIATLGMLGVARGTAKWLANQPTVNPPATWVNELAVTFPPFSWMLVAPGVWIALVLAVAMAFVLRRTVFGRRVFALGSSEAAARACGIPIERLKLQVYGIAGLLFGLAGVMQMSRLRQGDPTVAAGTELDVIAAVVIGGGSLSGGEGTILGSMIGALVMAFLRNGSQQMGWPNYVQEIIIGVIIVVAVAIDRWRHAQQGETE